MGILINFLSAIYSLSGFLLLISKRMKAAYVLSLLTYFFLLYAFFDSWMGQWLTFLLVSGAVIIVFIGTGKSLLNVLLSLTGYLIVILINHLFSIPLSWSGLPLGTLSTLYPVPCLLVFIFTSNLVLLLFRRFYLRSKYATLEKAPTKLLLRFLVVLCLGITLMAFNGILITV